MNLNTILSTIQQKLQGTILNGTISPLSNLYFLLRAIAACIVDLYEETRPVTIMDATDVELDAMALLYGIIRKEGTPANGYALVLGPVPKGTVMLTPDNVTIILNEAINNSGETRVAVTVGRPGEAVIPAGTPLRDPVTGATGVVGLYRNPFNEAVGDIVNGTDRESDDDLRIRVLEYLDLSDSSSLSALRATIINEINTLSRIVIVDSDPTPGYITVYTDASDERTLFQISKVIENNKAVGIGFRVRTLRPFPYNVRVAVAGNVNAGLVIRQYFRNLAPLTSPSARGIGLALVNSGASSARVLSTLPLAPVDTMPVLESVEVVPIG